MFFSRPAKESRVRFPGYKECSSTKEEKVPNQIPGSHLEGRKTRPGLPPSTLPSRGHAGRPQRRRRGTGPRPPPALRRRGQRSARQRHGREAEGAAARDGEQVFGQDVWSGQGGHGQPEDWNAVQEPGQVRTKSVVSRTWYVGYIRRSDN
ncbi:uncharacterized protein LOC133663088 isoform X1 [Entelurus aequoreus]|uniref:uncharacterized protein LOC133663088 isoform X1 n=1 Tax=Entelurus aequoreus TaxID=161455 RepID=UPI002B1DE26A|nr:uncharacterized protein LOC133663088 isoform X1 [Entelurus aequoreus]